MNVEKQLTELHDNLRQILDPDDYGWVQRPTEVVIDDLIMAGVEFEKCKNRPLESIEKCNDREKLIELLYEFSELDEPGDGRTWWEHLADFLIEKLNLTLLENNLEVSRVMLREEQKKREKAEHDRDRYARKIEELTEQNERLRAEYEKAQIFSVFPKEEELKYLNALERMAKEYKTVRADTVENLCTRFAVHFGTYTDKDTVKVSEVFRLLSKFTEEICDTTN